MSAKHKTQTERNNALFEAAVAGDADAVKAALDDKANIDATTPAGGKMIGGHYWGERYTALRICVSLGHVDLARSLLKAGADVNFHPKGTDTPLMEAAGKGDVKMVKVLIKAGAALGVQNKHGETARDQASWTNHKDVVKAIDKALAKAAIDGPIAPAPAPVAAAPTNEKDKKKKKKKNSEDSKESHNDNKADEQDGDKKKRKRKSKGKRDPNAPKKPLSGYLLYLADARGERKDGDEAPKDIMKELAAQWKDLPDAEKEKYNAKAAEDKKRYEEEMKAYSPDPALYTKSGKPVEDADGDDEDDDGDGKKKKQKRKRRKKDKNEPKRAMTSFLFFSQDKRAELKAKNPDAKPAEIMSMFGQMWRDMSEKEKEPYERKAAAAKAEYAQQLEKYKNKKGAADAAEAAEAADAGSDASGTDSE